MLYINGLSLKTIGKLLNVSNLSVLNRIRKYALQNYEKSKPMREIVIIELDEIWHFLKLKKQALDMHIAVVPENLLTENMW